MTQDNVVHKNNYLIKQLPQATAFIDMNYKIQYVSDQWINDFSNVSESCLGISITDLFSLHTPEWRKVLDECLAGEPGLERVGRYLDIAGNEKWLELLKTAWHDNNENVIGWIIQADKASLRMQNEVQLDKFHILSTQMSEIAKIGLWEYNLAEDELYWSDMTKIIHEVPLDYKPSIDQATNFYKSGYSRNTIAMTVQRALANRKSWSEKLQLVTAKGNEIWVIASGKSTYKNGEFTGLVGAIQNINSLTLSELKTRENEYHLRTLIDNLPLNVFIKDLDSKKILVNKSEMEYCGVSKEEDILGKDDFEFLDYETAKRSRSDDLKVMHDLKSILSKEMVHYRKDGTETVFLTSKIPLVNNDDSVYGLVGISMDITDLKQKETQLRKLVAVSAKQNKKLVNFAHIVSHNLRSHTANFSMLLDFLTHEKNEDEKKRIVLMLTKASDNLLETLDNLNEVVNINSSNNISKKLISLNSIYKKVEENLIALFSEHNVHIINNISDDIKVTVVPSYLEDIIMNLITNAVKYRSPARFPVIKLSAKQEKDSVIFSVADNGLGIDLKKHGDKLFGMYKTFHENTEAKGIGLFIVKNQIEAMGGSVTAESEVGKGSTFRIHFNEKN